MTDLREQIAKIVANHLGGGIEGTNYKAADEILALFPTRQVMVECPECKGEKTILRDFFGCEPLYEDEPDEISCPKCHGTGTIPTTIPVTQEDWNGVVARIANLERSEADLIGERDFAQEWADLLAYAVATEEVIGEHSNLNNPWKNAVEELERERERVRGLEGLVKFFKTTHPWEYARVTGACPKCGAQIKDPFGMGKTIHDIEKCCGLTLK